MVHFVHGFVQATRPRLVVVGAVVVATVRAGRTMMTALNAGRAAVRAVLLSHLLKVVLRSQFFPTDIVLPRVIPTVSVRLRSVGLKREVNRQAGHMIVDTL